MASPVSTTTLLQKVRLVPWSLPHPHNRRLAVQVKNLELVRQLISEIYDLEKGNYPELRLQYTTLQYARNEPEFVLVIQNMHNYYLLDQWLHNENNYRVFYHHAIPAANEPQNASTALKQDHVYLRWGYELAQPAIRDELAAQAVVENALVLVGNAFHNDDQVLSPCVFRPIVEILELVPGVSVSRGRPAEGKELTAAVTPASSNPLLAIEIELYGIHQREVIPPYKKEALKSLINDLQFQLSVLEHQEREFVACELCAYEESLAPSGVTSTITELQAFLINTPLDKLRQYHYKRIELVLAGQPRVFHLMVPAYEDNLDSRQLPFPPNPSRRFYLHPDWRGSRFYLPIDPGTNRRMDFYPPLRYGENFGPEHLNKIQKALLGGYQPDADERVIFWPHPERMDEMETVYCLPVSEWETLDQVWGQVNLSTIKAAELARPSKIDELLEPVVTNASPQLAMVENQLQEEIDRQFKALDKTYQSFSKSVEEITGQVNDNSQKLARIRQDSQTLEQETGRLNKLDPVHWSTFYQTVLEIQQDLQNTVTGLAGAAQNIANQAALPQTPLELARQIRDSADRLNAIANGLDDGFRR